MHTKDPIVHRSPGVEEVHGHAYGTSHARPPHSPREHEPVTGGRVAGPRVAARSVGSVAVSGARRTGTHYPTPPAERHHAGRFAERLAAFGLLPHEYPHFVHRDCRMIMPSVHRNALTEAI
jgi:hypothetical protein